MRALLFSPIPVLIMSEEEIRVMIVDDHLMVIEGLKALLAGYSHIHVASSFTHGQEALAFLETTVTDVVLLDVSLPDINGVEMCRRICTHYPKTKVLGLSTYGEPSIVNQMIKHQVSGYLLKSATADELVRAIYCVHQNQRYFDAEVQKVLDSTVLKSSEEIPRLTRREKEIIQRIADGQTTHQMAEALFISPLTVETHRRNLMKKMRVSNSASLIKLALKSMIIA